MKKEVNNEPNLKGLWEECTFIFDSSILMDLYAYPEIYNEFIYILEEIHNRIWIPYQTGLEFHKISYNYIKIASENYKGLKSSISDLRDDSRNLAQKIMDLNYDSFKSLKIDASINKSFLEIDTILENMSKSLRNPNHDEIITKLNSIFNGKTGPNYPDSRLKEIYSKAKIKNIKKNSPLSQEREYSKLISWYQILDYANKEKKDIIFVTENPDWGTKTKEGLIEPRPFLLKEFSSTGQEFYIYSLTDFLRGSKNYLNIDIMSTASTAVIEELTDFSNKLKERKNKEIEALSSDIALREMIDNTLLSESELQRLINQSTAYKSLQKLIDQKIIDESDLQKMITSTLLGESALQKVINQNTSYGALQKLIDQKIIDENDLQKMITRTIMSENVLQKLIDQNSTTKNTLEELLKKKTNKTHYQDK